MSRGTRPTWAAPILACLVTLLGLPAHAGVAFPDTPMQTNQGIPPNIWFILDDSGSMGYTYMPDAVPGTTPTNIANQAYTRNTIYYNPNNTYRPWQGADGSYFPDTPYTAAWNDLEDLSSATNLSGSTQTFYMPNVGITDYADAKQYTRYRFLTNGTADACTWRVATNNFGTCVTNVTSFPWPGGAVRNHAQEKQNYATW